MKEKRFLECTMKSNMLLVGDDPWQCMRNHLFPSICIMVSVQSSNKARNRPPKIWKFILTTVLQVACSGKMEATPIMQSVQIGHMERHFHYSATRGAVLSIPIMHSVQLGVSHGPSKHFRSCARSVLFYLHIP